ncbi:MAG TPA: response regulator [Candidatus Woesebacteria bacterium]|nr:response regulator [Candidatus Woesebacteria bacterium]
MKLLIIEDDVFFQKFYKSQLEAQGFEVDVGKNGNEGLEKIASFKPDVILLDIIMPEKDGFEVLESLAKDGSIKNLPVLIFSTLGQEKDVQRAMELGAKGYVNKSFFDFNALVNKIKEIAS